MKAKLVTRYLSEQEYPAWTQLVSNSAEGSIYSTPEYLDVLCSEIGGRFKILAAERAGELLAGIALVERASRWGTYVSGRLLLYYNGIVLRPDTGKYPSERTAKALECLGSLETAIRQAGYGRVHMKSRATLRDIRVFLDRGWRAEPSYTYLIPLHDPNALWAGVEQNLRRLISRCERESMQLSEDADFDSFYRLHHQTHLRKGAALYLPEPSFRRYFERLRSQNLCRLFHARTSQGRLASTQLVLLGPHPVCHTVAAAADPDLLRTGATAFLRWKVFLELSKLGYTANDLTDAQLNPVTHFKSQFGGSLEMAFVLKSPERAAFLLQGYAHRAASVAKRTVRGAIQAVRAPAFSERS